MNSLLKTLIRVRFSQRGGEMRCVNYSMALSTANDCQLLDTQENDLMILYHQAAVDLQIWSCL